MLILLKLVRNGDDIVFVGDGDKDDGRENLVDMTLLFNVSKWRVDVVNLK